MLMSSLRVAPVIAVFLAWVPAPTLAQSLDQGFHQNAADPLNGSSSLFAKKITDRVKLKPWAVQLSAGFSRERVLAAYTAIETRHATLLADKDAAIVSSVFRSRGTQPFYQVHVGTNTFESAIDLCTEIRRAGGACTVLSNKLNQDNMDGSVSASAIQNIDVSWIADPTATPVF